LVVKIWRWGFGHHHHTFINSSSFTSLGFFVSFGGLRLRLLRLRFLLFLCLRRESDEEEEEEEGEGDLDLLEGDRLRCRLSLGGLNFSSRGSSLISMAAAKKALKFLKSYRLISPS